MTIMTRLTQLSLSAADYPVTNSVGLGNAGSGALDDCRKGSAMTKPYTAPNIDEYLRERLMPVEVRFRISLASTCLGVAGVVSAAAFIWEKEHVEGN